MLGTMEYLSGPVNRLSLNDKPVLYALPLAPSVSGSARANWTGDYREKERERERERERVGPKSVSQDRER